MVCFLERCCRGGQFRSGGEKSQEKWGQARGTRLPLCPLPCVSVMQEIHAHCREVRNCTSQGIPWRSSGKDSELSLPWARVQSLVGELRSLKLRGAAEKKKEKEIV